MPIITLCVARVSEYTVSEEILSACVNTSTGVHKFFSDSYHNACSVVADMYVDACLVVRSV